MPNILVSTQWLEDHLDQKNLVLLDASMVQVVGREPVTYAEPLYIPTARSLNLETDFFDHASSQIHALPTEEQFRQAIKVLGINQGDQIVFYDNQGIYSSPRAWWTFHLMGIENLHILDGGLPKWIAEGRQTIDKPAEGFGPSKDLPKIHFRQDLVYDSLSLLGNLQNPQIKVIDARSQQRFLGQAEEPRQGVRKGRIPGSINLPFNEVLKEDCCKSKPELEKIFSDLGITKTDTLTFTCGSGVTACIILLASVICGFENQILYDGSWADWGSDPNLPID